MIAKLVARKSTIRFIEVTLLYESSRYERSLTREGVVRRGKQVLERLRRFPDCQAAASRQLPPQRIAGAVGGSVDGDVEVRIGFLDHDTAMMRQWNLNLATFVETAARAIDVGQPYGDAVDIVARTIKRELKSPLGMLAQAVGQIDPTGFDIDSHEAALR
ncbi:MAG: hypothetical protein QM739_15535 [Propionivibrio sp.]